MRGLPVRPIVIAVGGTGGHFFPAEALASELVARGHRIALMTDARSGGLRSAVFAGHETFVLRGAGIAGRGALRAGHAALTLAAGTAQARAILSRLDAAVIVGFGGYPCVAPVLASRMTRRRPAVVLHEQNAVLGRANRALARFADRLALGMGDTTRLPAGLATVLTGNPVRPAIRALAGLGYVPPDVDGPIRLLVTGGSQGARVFSDAMPQAIALLPESLHGRLRIMQQCRPEDLDRVRAAYAAQGVDAELAAFFPDMAARLAAAHFVVARAGASTVTELCVAGRPGLLVPLPGSIDQHQAENAKVSGADVLRQAEFEANPQALADALAARLSYPALLADQAEFIARAGIPDAAARLANLVEHMAHANLKGVGA
jgi:UDP-N-acetylglucosamine--N-acetylmuramyl-(pentapeptide) pyrophosphoryl-undecaprenol N-acetylglucosamine transferase